MNKNQETETKHEDITENGGIKIIFSGNYRSHRSNPGVVEQKYRSL